MKKELKISLPHLIAFLFLVFLTFAGDSVLSMEVELRVRILEGRVTGTAVISASGEATIEYGGKRSEVPANFIVSSLEGGKIEVRFDKGVGEELISTFAPLTVSTKEENALLSVRVEGKLRPYRGDFLICNEGKDIVIINVIDLSDYLLSVVPSEMEGTELEALKAQAIVSRTFALKNLGRHKTYDFCDLTHCQHYRGAVSETAFGSRAVSETAGGILTYGGEPATVFYHACSGGMITSPEYVWGGAPIPYLLPKTDRIAGKNLWIKSPHASWEFRLEREKLFDILTESLGTKVTGLYITGRDPSGRVRSFRVLGTKEREITGEDFRIIIGRELGWNGIKSTLFEMEEDGGDFIFSGRGLGHGVGMSQAGAIELSKMGYDYKEILEFYFPKTEIESIQ